MNNSLFKLILIEEIKRFAINSDIKSFYESLPEDELKFQLICVDATLSRGSLPLLEKYLLNKNVDRNEINNKITELSDYKFYSTSKRIYDRLYDSIIKNDLHGIDILNELTWLAVNGELDQLVER